LPGASGFTPRFSAQVHVFGHDDETVHRQVKPCAGRFKISEKQIANGRRYPLTTERYEMTLPRLLKPAQTAGHGHQTYIEKREKESQ
jgi:hypothetical protein